MKLIVGVGVGVAEVVVLGSVDVEDSTVDDELVELSRLTMMLAIAEPSRLVTEDEEAELVMVGLSDTLGVCDTDAESVMVELSETPDVVEGASLELGAGVRVELLSLAVSDAEAVREVPLLKGLSVQAACLFPAAGARGTNPLAMASTGIPKAAGG